jgi:thymidylate kinase
LALGDPRRYLVIDADGSVDEVHQRAMAKLAERAPELCA